MLTVVSRYNITKSLNTKFVVPNVLVPVGKLIIVLLFAVAKIIFYIIYIYNVRSRQSVIRVHYGSLWEFRAHVIKNNYV